MTALLHNAPDDPRADGPLPFAQFRAAIAAMYAPPIRSKGTQARILKLLDSLPALGVTTTADLTTALVSRFVAAQPAHLSPNTVYSNVSVLRAAVNVAAAEGWVRFSPFALRRKWVKRVSPRDPHVHSREEIARVLELLEADVRRKTAWAQWRARRLHAIAATVAFTGIRKLECLRLQCADVDLDGGMLLIHSRKGGTTKTEASAQPVPMPDALVEILRAWMPFTAVPRSYRDRPGVSDTWLFPNAGRTGPWVFGAPGSRPLDQLKAAGERAGVENFTFLSLRHSWASHAEFFGLTDAQIQRVLRHTNGATQWHYRHAERANMRAMVKAIDFTAPPSGGPEARP